MKNYSIAIFGSSLRDDFDKYSDKDLLIVADSYKTLENLKTIYSKDNWSISYYTYSKLKYLSKHGSLFIKHLKNESEILNDSNNNLKAILDEFQPKHSYQFDIKDSKNYFNILEYLPNSELGLAWFCDCFFVGFRNYLVFKNAENEIFEFSFKKLLQILKNNNEITENDITTLKELRVVKRNYRENILDELPSKEFVLKVIKIAKKIGLLPNSNIISTIDFQEDIEHKILNKHFNSYQRLRLVEGYYCSQKRIIPELKKIVSNPQFYASKLKDDKYTMELIKKIKKRHTTMGIKNYLIQ
jgi:Nucleotidyltransferase domain